MILLLWCSRGATQTLFAEFQLSSDVTSFDVISNGDSILFSSEEMIKGKTSLTTKWINKNGTSHTVDLSQPVSIVHSQDQNIHYYSLDGSKSQNILTCFESRANGSVQALPSLSLPDGIVVGAFSEQNLFVIIYQRDLNLISVHEVKAATVINEKRYPVSKDLRVWIRKASDVDFVLQRQTQLNTLKGAARVKLILDGDLYLTLDNHMDNETLVEVLRKDGSVKEYRYPVMSNEDFASYIIDGKLFTTIMSNKKFEMKVVALESKKPVASVALDNDEAIDVIFRSVRYKSVQKETFKYMMRVAPLGDPQLTVGYDSGKYFIAWGSYIDDNGGGVVAGANPLSMLATFVITTAVKQMSEGPGLSRQFFYKLDGEKFDLVTDKTYPRMKLDEYEMAQIVKGVKLKSKSYLPYRDGLMAVYHLQKEKAVRIMVFE